MVQSPDPSLDPQGINPQRIDQSGILKHHDRQLKLARRLAKVGYNSPQGKFFRLISYYRDGVAMVRKWRGFLEERQVVLGDRFFGMDHAILHTNHQDVQDLMQTEPQIRGNDLGIIRILAPSYLLNNPLSLGMNGQMHSGARAVFLEALPNPQDAADRLSQVVEQRLDRAAQAGRLQVGDDIPSMMIGLLHQLVFDLSLSEEEVSGSRGYIKGLILATLPNPVSKFLLRFKTGPNTKHRKRLIQKYQQSPRWGEYLAIAQSYGLNSHQISNSLFDMIHIAGTAGTSALLGSVIGVLCQNETLRREVDQEIQALWENGAQGSKKGVTAEMLSQASLLHNTILETARLYPPVRFVSQLAQKPGEVEISGSKCPFQQGTRLLGSIFTANRDPNRYENPDIFDPQRDFSDLLAWNGWRHERACPGRELSIGLVQVFCFYLFHKYQWQPSGPIAWDFDKVTAVTPNELVLEHFQRN